MIANWPTISCGPTPNHFLRQKEAYHAYASVFTELLGSAERYLRHFAHGRRDSSFSDIHRPNQLPAGALPVA